MTARGKTVPLLVLGLGNLLCRDDGLGVVAVHRLLRSHVPPPGTEVLDGGTLGLSLLPYLEDAEQAILVDAIGIDAPAGTVVRLDGDEVAPAVAARLSVHQIGVADLLEGARWLGHLPRRLVLLGAVPQTIEVGLGLTPSVEAAVPALITRILEEARALGYAFRPRTGDAEEPPPRDLPFRV